MFSKKSRAKKKSSKKENKVYVESGQKEFFEEKEHGQTNGIYLIDGTPVEGNALHPVGLLATIAQGSLILDDACADEWLRRFFSTPLRSGPRRYYDNCLYLFALLALSGHYRIWFPQEATV